MPITTDHEEIRKWAEHYHGHPQIIDDPEAAADKPGLRIDFTTDVDDVFLSEGKVRNITWDQFFAEFDAQQLAFDYQEYIDLEIVQNVIYDSYRFVKRDVLKEK